MSKKYKTILITMAMLFACVVARAAAPVGSWWNGSYGYRQQILIPAGSSALPVGYAVQVTLNHAALVTATKSLASGNDVRVVYWNGTTWVELDRVLDADDTWNSASSTIWFKTQAAVTASITDNNYYIYYGNTGAGTPPQNDALVFSLFDHFLGASLDTTKWTATGTISVTGSNATVDRNENFRSVLTFPTDTIWETRASMSTASPNGNLYYFAANSNTGNSTFANYLRFNADNTANDFAQLSSGASTGFSPTSSITSQLYSFTREGAGAARFFQNGIVVASYVSGAPSGNLVVLVRDDATSGTVNQVYDWIRVRPYRNPEPALSLVAEEFYYPAPVASYSFEQASWNGTAGEVTDSGPNGLNGRAVNGAATANTTPAIAGTTGTCRYATLDGTNDYISVTDNPQLDITAQFGFAAWVRHRTNTYKAWETMLAKGDSAYRIHLNGSCNITGTLAGNTTNGLTEGLNSGCTTADLNSNQVPAANTWYHLAATHDGNTMKIYVNGTLINQATYNATIASNNFDLVIGENAQNTGRQWTGDIDEVSIWNTAVSQSVVQAHRAATHACNTIPHFVIQHSGYGINCVGESITINVRDIANNPYVGYGQQITLDTGSGKGDWSLTTGNGTLNNGTANDGIATYQWSAADTSATFSLSYKEGAASININAYQTSDITIRDNDLEGNMLWSPSGFTVTSSPLSNPPPGAIPAFASPQTAGNNFNLYIAAYGTTPTDNQCGVIEAYTGAKNLKFWSTYANPATGTRVVAVNASNIATVEASSLPQAVTFTNGQASVVANYKDAGQISISMKDDSPADPVIISAGGIRGSTGNFVVKPSTFVLSNIKRTSDNVLNPAAANATGAVFIAAGQTFTATVNAKESGGLDTPNFGKESTPESVALTSTLVLPGGGQNPSIAAGTGFTAFSSGIATGTDFSWPEVGIITLTPHIKDSDYLGAGDVIGTTTGNVGRFIPYNFGVTQNSPTITPACPAGSFLYLGQPLTYSIAPVLSVTARALGGATTQNYQGAFFKLTNASSTGRNYVTSAGTLNQSGLPANDPTALSLNNGLATLTFNANSGLVYTRSTPVAPFTPTLTLSLNVLDTDGVAYSNSPSTLTNNPFVINTPSIVIPEQRYGRIAFRNSVGSELLNLPLPMHSEYFSSNTAGFVQNAADTCTTGLTNTLALNLTAGGSSCLLNSSSCPGPAGQQFQMPPVAGDFVANLRAPGVGYTGTVTVTASVPTWLQFDWDASTPALENPQGIATFGIFPGRSRRIFQAEK